MNLIVKLNYSYAVILPQKEALQLLKILGKASKYIQDYNKGDSITDLDEEITISYISEDKIRELKLVSSLQS
jgi:hypothetical protein